MSEYNTYYDAPTRTSISQVITADGKHAVLLCRGLQSQVIVCNGPEEQYQRFLANVKWYRGY